MSKEKLTSEIAKLKEEKDLLRQYLDADNLRLGELRQACYTEEEKVKELKKEEQKLSQEIEVARKELWETSEKNKVFRHSNHLFKQENDRLDTEIKIQRDVMNNLLDENHRYDRRKIDLENKISVLEEEIIENQQEIESLRSEHDRVAQEFIKERDLQAQEKQGWEAEIQALIARKAEIEEEIEEFDFDTQKRYYYELLDRIRNEEDSYKARHEKEKEALKAELDELKDKLVQLKEEMARESDRQNERLLEKESEVHELETRKQGLERVLKQIKAEIVRLEQEKYANSTRKTDSGNS